jgi:hypothetical protein
MAERVNFRWLQTKGGKPISAAPSPATNAKHKESAMSESTANAPMVEDRVKCEDVEKTEWCTWEINLREYGGDLHADWNSNTDFEPDHAHIVLYLGGKEVKRHKTGMRKGTYHFKDFKPGTGFKVALVAKGFASPEAAVVATRETRDNDDLPIKAEAKHQYRLALQRNKDEPSTLLTWGTPGTSNDPPFRPREGKIYFDVKGEDRREYSIDEWHKTIETGVRWGAGLKATYSAESFGHAPKRIELVQIQTS